MPGKAVIRLPLSIHKDVMHSPFCSATPAVLCLLAALKTWTDVG
jgi:hypothetical protein